MDADDVEAPVRAGGFLEHALEGGPAVIGCRSSRLDELRGDDPTLSLAKTPGQVPLGRNGHIACGLAAGAYPQIERGSSRRQWIRPRRSAERHGSISIELEAICVV